MFKALNNLAPAYLCNKFKYVSEKHNRQVEQKPGGRGRGREYNNLPFKMHFDSIITRSCWIGD